jgi:hypothetical protein
MPKFSRSLRARTFFEGETLINLRTVTDLMVQAQDKMNSTVDPLWHTKAFPFFRAAHAEAHEAFGHTSWEWWKNLSANHHDVFRKREDIAEFHMELVDVLHFLLAHIINSYKGENETPDAFWQEDSGRELLRLLDHAEERSKDEGWASSLGDVKAEEATEQDKRNWTLHRIESLISACLEANLSGAVQMLVETANHTGLGLAGLLGGYFAKQALNLHRAANGYKEGTYVKIWDEAGHEDNYFLNQMIAAAVYGVSLDDVLQEIIDGSLTANVVDALAIEYQRVLDAKERRVAE